MTPDSQSDSFRTVTFFRAPDDRRVVAVWVRGDFDEFAKFRPFVETEEERRHLLEAYQISNPEKERTTKAHITDDEWPLQLVLLEREPGALTKPHYHVNDGPAQSPTRHQIMICQRGSARIGIFTTKGEHVGSIVLKEDDIVLLAEGHSVEFLEPRTRLIEIKQGPFPSTDADDKVDLKVEHR